MSKHTDTPATPSQLNHNTQQPYQYTVHRLPNNINYKVSTITKFYSKTDPHIIPTSIDLDIQKVDNIPTTSTTTFSHK